MRYCTPILEQYNKYNSTHNVPVFGNNDIYLMYFYGKIHIY